MGCQRHAPAALPPRKTRYPLYERLGGPLSRSGEVRKISPLPEFDPRTVQPVASRYTDWAIPAPITTVLQSFNHSASVFNWLLLVVASPRPFRSCKATSTSQFLSVLTSSTNLITALAFDTALQSCKAPGISIQLHVFIYEEKSPCHILWLSLSVCSSGCAFIICTFVAFQDVKRSI